MDECAVYGRFLYFAFDTWQEEEPLLFLDVLKHRHLLAPEGSGTYSRGELVSGHDGSAARVQARSIDSDFQVHVWATRLRHSDIRPYIPALLL